MSETTPAAAGTADLTAHLNQIRERHALVTGPESSNFSRIDELHAAGFQLSHEDAGVLLAAVDALLADHILVLQPMHRPCERHRDLLMRAATLPALRAAEKDCPDCTVTEEQVCKTCKCPDDEWPCLVYRTISGALLATGAHQ